MRFKTVLDESGCNRSMRLRLEYKDTEIYSKHNEGKSDVAQRFTKTLKDKICKYMTSKSKNLYIDKLLEIVK